MQKHEIRRSRLVTALEVAEQEFLKAADTVGNDRLRRGFEEQADDCRKAIEALEAGYQLHVEE